MVDEITPSSGNVFADLGLPDADELARKAALIGSIMRAAQTLGLSQSELARRVNIPQPRLSDLFRGRIKGISTDKLLDAVSRLGSHVRIVVEEHPETAAAGRVELVFA